MNIVTRAATWATRALAAAVLCSVLSGCETTTLTVNPITQADARKPSTGEYIYLLPRTTFLVTGIVTLNGCKGVFTTPSGPTKPSLDISELISAVPVVEADPDQQYAIPYDALRSWKREINLTITSGPNKVLTGVNGAVNDQVGPVTVAAALAAVKIAAAVGVPGAAIIEQPPFNPLQSQGTKKPKPIVKPRVAPDYCAPPVVAALAAIDEDNVRIRAASVQDAKDKVTIANPKIAAWQADIVYQQAAAGLIRKFSFVWVPTFADEVVATAPPGQAPARPAQHLWLTRFDLYGDFIKAWLNPAGQNWIASNPTSAQASSIVPPVNLQLAVKEWSMGSASDNNQPRHTTDFVIRDPAIGLLRICRGPCVTSSDTSKATDVTSDLATPASVTVAQLGRKVIYPLHNQTFENNTLAITVSADGTVTSVGNHSIGTLAAGLGTVGQVGDALSGAAAARNTAVTAVNTAVTSAATYEDTINKALADCLSQQQAVRAAGGTPIGSCR